MIDLDIVIERLVTMVNLLEVGVESLDNDDQIPAVVLMKLIMKKTEGLKGALLEHKTAFGNIIY